MFTASSVFLKSLSDAGITHAFVNWGSDHPALLEDLERQRVQGNGTTKPQIITCPNEMVAVSAAQGFTQVTGKPSAVIVHVDVGTQAMAGAIHNIDRSRAPILIYAGASPFSSLKELKGGRNEWRMLLQDIPDQSAIVRQYMRYTSQIGSGSTVSQYVRRALQMATSEPKGPAYLWARRETMEEEIPASVMNASSDLLRWPSVDPSTLSPTAVATVASALISSQNPLIITSFLGRNPRAVSSLISLSTLLAIPIFVTCPSAVNVPFSHPYFVGVSFCFPGSHTPLLATADTILVIDCEIPWIPANDPPPKNARVFVLDSGDPLKRNVGFWHVDAELVCRADAKLALEQITEAVCKISESSSTVENTRVQERVKELELRHEAMVRELDKAEETYLTSPAGGGITVPVLTVPNIMGVLRKAIKAHTPSHGQASLILNESISNYPAVWQHMRPGRPGGMISSGGSSLGWGLGAAVGAILGGRSADGEVSNRNPFQGHDLVVLIVGDGSFMFGVPSSAYWMASKYDTPFLTIILNNGGWRSPKLSMLGVHPTGHGSQASGEKLSVGFGPVCPDYSQIAVAASAGQGWGRRAIGRDDLEVTVAEAVRIVVQEKRCATVDCVIETI